MLMSPESRVPVTHPIRRIKMLSDDALRESSRRCSTGMYSATGRPSIPPGRLLKASLVMALFSVRSERLVLRRARLQPALPLVPRHGSAGAELRRDGVRPQNRRRRELMAHAVGRALFDAVVSRRGRARTSRRHFTVDGSLIEAAASLKSFKPQGRRRSAGARGHGKRCAGGLSRRAAGQRDARVDDGPEMQQPGAERPSKEAKLSYSAHALMENRRTACSSASSSSAAGGYSRAPSGSRPRRQMPARRRPAVCIPLAGADKDYDTRDGVAACRDRIVTPHVAQKTSGRQGASMRGRRAAAATRIGQRLRTARRGDLRVDEDGGRVPEDTIRRLRSEPGGRDAHRSGLQPGPNGPGSWSQPAPDDVEERAVHASASYQPTTK